ncbi:MAG: multicopper oxidase family protein [Culicoidibacterales bacterium]
MRKYIVLSLMSIIVLVMVGCTAKEPQTLASPDAYQVKKNEPQTAFTIIISQTAMTLANQEVERYQYTDSQTVLYPAGVPLIMEAGKLITFTVENQTDEVTNIHWHGLTVPNDQDGPNIKIQPQQTYEYQFVAPEPGTYWYHAHNRPVRDQVDAGMYGPLIILAPEDEKYTGDAIFMLDDWLGTNQQMMMEQIGTIDTVNGLSGEAIPPLQIEVGGIYKLRLINASTAKTQQLRFPVPVRITHTDGHALTQAQIVESLTIYPGERYDVELQISQQPEQEFAIRNEREAGLVIPLEVKQQEEPMILAESPWQPAVATPLTQIDIDREADFTFVLERDGMHGNQHWLINGEAYPNTATVTMKQGETYKIRYENRGMHAMTHPMHIHGSYFRIITENDQPVTNELWKDTVGVPAGGSLELLITFTQPGTWMLHCHILDHEDQGMMLELDVQNE